MCVCICGEGDEGWRGMVWYGRAWVGVGGVHRGFKDTEKSVPNKQMKSTHATLQHCHTLITVYALF